MLRVIVESPYAGNVPMNECYGRMAMNDCLTKHNESPYASHLLYTQPLVLDDLNPDERKLGISAGFFWRDVADKTVFYVDLGMTKGMEQGIEDCEEKGKSYEIRFLPAYKWTAFCQWVMHKGYGNPPIEFRREAGLL